MEWFNVFRSFYLKQALLVRVLHGLDSLSILVLFDPLNLNHLLETVLKLSHEVTGTYHDQLARVRLTGGRELDR